MFKPREQANATTVLRAKTVNRKAAFSCMDLFCFIFAGRKAKDYLQHSFFLRKTILNSFDSNVTGYISSRLKTKLRLRSYNEGSRQNYAKPYNNSFKLNLPAYKNLPASYKVMAALFISTCLTTAIPNTTTFSFHVSYLATQCVIFFNIKSLRATFLQMR